MISLVMKMRHVLRQRMSKRRFPKQDEPRETLLLDRPHPALRVGVQIWRPRWQGEWTKSSDPAFLQQWGSRDGYADPLFSAHLITGCLAPCTEKLEPVVHLFGCQVRPQTQ